jgi:hypothetical protein
VSRVQVGRLLPAVALVVACGGGGGGDPTGDSPSAGAGPTGNGGSGAVPGSGGSGNRPAVTGGASPGGGSAGQSQGTGGHPDFTADCAAPATGSPVLRLLTRNELDQTLSDVFPEIKGQWTNSLPAAMVSKLTGFDNEATAQVGGQLAGALLDTALSVASAVTGERLGTLLPCAASGGDRACATDFLTRYGRRLFRRPLTSAESMRYLTYFDAALAKSDFKTALKWMTVGLIQSPHAVYRREIGAVQADGSRTLSPGEVATELAYTYTGSTPTEALLSKAESGNLGDTVALAKELLSTEPGKQAFQRFFEAYVGYPRAAAIQKPKVQDYAAVSADMPQETRRFIDDVLLQKGGGVKELLTATTTNPSVRLAQYYGITAPSADYASVTRPPGRGIGLFAQGAFLATRASSDASSPTQRGIFLLTRLLCRDVPEPPATVPPLATGNTGPVTTRQRYEQEHAQGGCAGCHQIFDPVGFGFEHFDEAGRYREQEVGLPVDSASHVPAKDNSVLFEFASQEELMTKLAEQPEVYQCFVGKLATYAFGLAQPCLGAGQVENLQQGNVGIAEAFAGLAAEPHFTRRKSN